VRIVSLLLRPGRTLAAPKFFGALVSQETRRSGGTALREAKYLLTLLTSCQSVAASLVGASHLAETQQAKVVRETVLFVTTGRCA
jgi:hypothetical protein